MALKCGVKMIAQNWIEELRLQHSIGRGRASTKKTQNQESGKGTVVGFENT